MILNFIHEIHGGSFVAYAGHAENQQQHPTDSLQAAIDYEQRNKFQTHGSYIEFANRIVKLRDKISETIHRLTKKGATIYAFGAPAKGTVLLNYCNLTSGEIPLATERNP